ncbi:tRNA pseudouridine38-40 synthase [Tistlia consotensis]|uniref:tRNA pseudouridine synthase A n=1 Tax=Tistlia consotensis USBA 355 TaxID=560819 RepID=A0A1Y6BHE0_9PROT|nr:tRNA pseudouridine(38-40) synthase TruA [Tistlia consotensis]SMF07715.1 tRNA pseudouridine38-40 synthase [Tistlia consotensis USBA 355]SNR35733.1 tRNA pseudouridine38-40 synthase [Tistlia consotensis]
MPRYKLTIEYDGAGFVGWQRQANGLSVQQALEEAVAAFCGERVTVHGAGRTDTGVHAEGQVAHLDLERDALPDKLRDAVNFHLKPRPAAVLTAEPADAGFHARFSAVERRYRYRIVNRRAPLVLDRGRAWWVPQPLDAAAMQQAADRLLGHHDFESFRSSECQARDALRTLDLLRVTRRGDVVELEVAARSFLHNQVRILAGTLRMVGDGRWTADDVSRALAARDRRAAGQTAPPDGLTLVSVRY